MTQTLNKASKLWFAFHGGKFRGTEPYYFDKRDFPWVEKVESQWLEVREELENLLKENGDIMTPYPIADMVTKPKRWKTFGFYFWKTKSHDNCKKCPKTAALLASIPNMTGASLNVLEPNTTIKPHHGDTNAIIRCHMGLGVPAPLPECGFKVGNEMRSWEDGKILMFCDAHIHTAWNNTSENRYILLIDIMRPEFASRTTEICCHALSALQLGFSYQRFAFLRKYFSSKRSAAVLHKLGKALLRLRFLLKGE